MIYNKQILTDLDQSKYEHPFDKAALEKLEKASFLRKAISWITENTIERVYTVQYTGSNLKVSAKNYPRIYDCFLYACKILDISNIPDLYLQWDYDINACTIGAKKPIVVINSGLIDLCDENEMLFVLGHELGHIKSNHMLYHMMAQLVDIIIDEIPGAALLSTGFKYSLCYWDRMSELTADRAGLLCCQDKDAAVRSFIKIAGLPINEYKNINCESFIRQARDFKMLDLEGMNKFVKLFCIADSSHPWTVLRAAEILSWEDSGKFQSLLDQYNNNILLNY